MFVYRWAQIAKHLPGRTDNEVKNFWNSSVKKKLISHHQAVSALSNVPNLPDPTSTFEGFLALSANPNLIPCTQPADQVYMPTQSPISMVQPFDHDHGVIRLDDQMVNFGPNLFNPLPPPVLLPLDPPPFDYPSSSWPSLNYHDPPKIDHDDDDHQQQHVLKQEDGMFITNGDTAIPHNDPLMGMPVLMPKLRDMINCIMPSSSSSFSNEVDPMSTLSSLPFGSSPRVSDQTDHENSMIISSPPLLLSSLPLSSMSVASALSSSPLQCSQFFVNPNLPTSWDP